MSWDGVALSALFTLQRDVLIGVVHQLGGCSLSMSIELAFKSIILVQYPEVRHAVSIGILVFLGASSIVAARCVVWVLLAEHLCRGRRGFVCSVHIVFRVCGGCVGAFSAAVA